MKILYIALLAYSLGMCIGAGLRTQAEKSTLVRPALAREIQSRPRVLKIQPASNELHLGTIYVYCASCKMWREKSASGGVGGNSGVREDI